jgi:hypothetical protein
VAISATPAQSAWPRSAVGWGAAARRSTTWFRLLERLTRRRPLIDNGQLSAGHGRALLVCEGQLSAGHGRALLVCEDHLERRRLARRAAAEDWSVRDLERTGRGRPAPPRTKAEDSRVQADPGARRRRGRRGLLGRIGAPPTPGDAIDGAIALDARREDEPERSGGEAPALDRSST